MFNFSLNINVMNVMKKIIYWSKGYLLPFCFMLAFGLMSCQEQEVIPLEEEDKTKERGGGGTTAPTNFFVMQSYSEKEFTGNQKTFYIDETNLSVSGNYEYEEASLNTVVESMIVGTGCAVHLWSEPNFTGSEILHSYGPAPLLRTSNFVTWTPQSLKIICPPNSVAEDRLCGWAKKPSGGRGSVTPKLPILKDFEYDLTNYQFVNWNDEIVSISSNDNSNCDGLMVYDHVTDVMAAHRWVDPDETIALASHVPGVSRILNSSQMAHSFDQVDFPVAAVLYSGDNYSGDSYILSKNDNLYKKLNVLFKSAVVAPDVTVKFRNYTGSSNWDDLGDDSAGYHPSLGLSKKSNGIYLTFKSLGRGNSTKQRNDYCGSAHEHISPAEDDFFGVSLPIFKGLTNNSLLDGSGAIDLYNLDVAAFNNKLSHFIPTDVDLETTCKGVTFWKDAPTDALLSQRRWISTSDNPSYGYVNFEDLNNSISTITTEGCKTPKLKVANMFTLALSGAGRTNSTNTTAVRQIGCEGARMACLAGQGVIVVGCAVGAAKLAGIDLKTAITYVQTFASGGTSAAMTAMTAAQNLLITINQRQEDANADDVEMQSLVSQTSETFADAVQNLQEMADQNNVDLEAAASESHPYHAIYQGIKFIGRAAGAIFGAVGAIDGSISLEGSLVHPSNTTYFCSRVKTYCETGDWSN
jgi:hypothetical protein